MPLFFKAHSFKQDMMPLKKMASMICVTNIPIISVASNKPISKEYRSLADLMEEDSISPSTMIADTMGLSSHREQTQGLYFICP